MKNVFASIALFFCTCGADFSFAHTQSAPQVPIFDAHLHYNVEAWAFVPPEKAFALFRQTNVIGILANSRPNEGSAMLIKQNTGALHIVPFARVYRDRDDYGDWFTKQSVYDYIVKSLDAEPRSKGIGEFHLVGEQANHPGVAKIMALAKARDLWLHAHVDELGLKRMLAKNPQAKIVWAHTGFTSAIEAVAEILQKHPNVIGELSYR